ncbi:RagB/SusD family nutrient uptake outer membrane protein [Bacteroides sp. 519]|uniref:RagB/SusD family nutrient uptake outer membrane protein n=1 Tax=Bacteroides sp. 519 TaxID=2302937 RepID=UPI0013D10A19|nr:RagB/SusD family nutrient uptake outer membrane protein [Bacteroides sp. 519]NDV59329.1 RagB/SusD family nutrient uptake outer membrane protein [Bacteroides sp. 519]
MKRIYIIFSLVASIMFTACSDFLDESPSTGLPAGEAITSLTDLRNAVNGVAYFLSTNNSNITVRMTYASDYGIYADLKGADFKALSNQNHAGPLSRYSVTKYDELPLRGYFFHYKALANVNMALESATNLNVSESEKEEYDNYIGELYAWRALIHFELSRIYCNPPTSAKDVNAANSGIVLSTETYPPGHKAARATLKETYDQILEDFKTALPLLSKATTNGRINYWAALALRARVHLYNGSNTEALADAEAVMASTLYSLYTIADYTKVWSQTYTSEALFELTVTTLYNPQRNSLGYYCSAEGYGECAFVEGGELLTYLQENPKDVRSELAVRQEGNFPGIYPAKYPGRDNSLYTNSPKVIRLADVYLIAAEAALKTSNDTKAVSYINTLRKNRITDYTDVTSITLDEILFERRIELFAENSMAFDYWRNKKSVINSSVGEVTYDDYRTILPIPQDEIDLAPDLLIQNPKY